MYIEMTCFSRFTFYISFVKHSLSYLVEKISSAVNFETMLIVRDRQDFNPTHLSYAIAFWN